MKSPVFKVLGFIRAHCPEALLRWFVRGILVASVLRVSRAKNISSLSRIRRFRQEPCSAKTLDRLCTELGDAYAASLLSFLSLCRPAAVPAIPKPISLELLPAVERLRRARKGVILASPHFGDLYCAMMALGHARLPLSVLLQGGDRFRWLECYGLRFLELGEGAASCVAALERNELVWLFTDIDYFPGGALVDFFGAPIYPPHGPVRMALATGAPILPVYTVQRKDGLHLCADEPIPVEAGSTKESLESLLLRSMERFIGAYPALWQTFEDIWELGAIKARNRRYLDGRY